MKFTTKSIDGQMPRIHGTKDAASAAEAFNPGTAPASVVEVLPDPDADAEWVRVRRQKVVAGPFTVGWMRKAHLDAHVGAPTVAPVAIKEFVHACARQELGATVGDDPAHAVQADYLIALALIESGLERFGPQTPNSDGVGPYQFGTKLWTELAGAEGLTDTDRFAALNQIPIATAVVRRDWLAFSALARPGGDTATDGPFVPSFLNLFHVWLIGVPAAHEVDRVNAQGDAGAPIGPILEKHHPGASNALMAARAAFLRDGRQDGRVAGFVRRTTQVLNDALAKAAALLVEHFPEFALPGGGTAAPWMEVAEREEQFWSSSQLVEASPAGAERVRAYFDATNHPVTAVEPWCGAFVAFCLKESGSEVAAASVVAGAAKAANWKSWGTVDLHFRFPGSLRRGAVVLLSPAANTGRSGHVAFLTGVTAGSDRVFCLGGNQSHRVNVSDFPTSRIVAIRWLDVDPTLADGAAAASVPEGVGDLVAVTPDDLLTMARTLYGEARGEERPGIEAVASVIMNRFNSPRYPNTIAGVCLQPWQFSCWNRNDPNRRKIVNLQPNADAEMAVCMAVAQEAASGLLADRTNGALHFHAVGIARPSWVLRSLGAISMTIGRHVFYRGIR
jgi:uncharacterized protein (TIGR02594 family)